MNVYKIRHTPSGLYFKPSRHTYLEKTNLSEKGKIYTSKPTLKFLGKRININTLQANSIYYESVNKRRERRQHYLNIVEEEWEIVKFNLVENKS